MTPRAPSLARVALYVREEMIDGATVAAVMAGNGRRHADRESTTVRWRVWARLRAEGYSFHGIAKRFNVDHGTIWQAMKQLAKGIVPFAHCRNSRLPRAQIRKHVRTRPKLITFAGYDPTERLVAGKLNEVTT